MSNRTIYMSIVAFAAAAAVNANTNAHAETPGHATLSQLIQEDLDAEQDAFTLALVERADARIKAHVAKIENVFGPLINARTASFQEEIQKTQHTDRA